MALAQFDVVGLRMVVAGIYYVLKMAKDTDSNRLALSQMSHSIRAPVQRRTAAEMHALHTCAAAAVTGSTTTRWEQGHPNVQSARRLRHSADGCHA